MKCGSTKLVFAWLLISAVTTVMAQDSGAPEIERERAPSSLPTIELNDLLDSVSRNSNKEFLVDNQVAAEVVIGQLDWHDVTYPLLLSILRNNELAAVTVQGVVNIVPVRAIRQYPLPVLYEDDETVADDEWVMRIMRPKKVRANFLVPILRPLLPQQGYISSVPESNTLIMVARCENARRIVEIVQDLDEHGAENLEKNTDQ